MSELSDKSRSFLQQKPIHQQWESDYLNPDMDRFWDVAFDDVLRRLKVTPSSTILDAGSGYCYHTKRLARSGAKITAVDFSDAALATASKTLDRSLHQHVSLQHADLTSLPFAENSFDFVVSWGVLMHIPELEKAVSELTRVLKHGGILVLNENNLHSLDVLIRENFIYWVKKLLRRRQPRMDGTARGTESWYDDGLMVRKTDMGFLIKHMQTLGMKLLDRTPCQFTEAYTNVPTKFLKRAIYGFNTFYFKQNFHAGLAMGNVLYFQKS